MCTLSDEEKALSKNMDTALNTILETVNTDVELYFTIPDGIALEIQGRGPSLSEFIKAFGGYFFK